MKKLVVLSTYFVFIGVIASCGVRTESAPRNLNSDQYKVSLKAPREISAAETARQSNLNGVLVYFINAESLRPVVIVQSGLPDPQSIINLLANLEGNSLPREGLRSALELEADLVKSAKMEDGVTVFDFDQRFKDLERNEQILLLGQITLSIIANGISLTVSFTIDGYELDFVNSKGVLVSRPAERSDFADLLSR